MYRKYIPRVLIIGAGPTCGLIVKNIKETANLCQAMNLCIWEKAKEVGGRFSTLRSKSDPNSFLDMGAQYFEQSNVGTELTNPYFQELLDDELVRDIEAKDISGYKPNTAIANLFVPTQGARTIVQNYFKKAEAKHTILFHNDVSSMKIVDFLGKSKVQVATHDGEREIFDIVISTIPPPNLLQFKDLKTVLTDQEIISKLEAVKYSSRFTIGTFFEKPLPLNTNDFAINYSNGSPFRLWTYENFKRSGNYKTIEPFALTAHTSSEYNPNVPYSDEYELRHKLYKEFANTVKSLNDYGNLPSAARVHFWQYSQVVKPYFGNPGFIILRKDPLILAGGDGFTYSGFAGCIESASKLVKYLSSTFPELKPEDAPPSRRLTRGFCRKPKLISEKSTNKVVMK